jgi:D-hydroxyproline dehydrogenase subunit gamma
MAEEIALTIDGQQVRVAPGTTVAVAILMAGVPARISVKGEPRAPFCGMGICMECRATVNGVAQQVTCQRLCEPGMEVATGGLAG